MTLNEIETRQQIIDKRLLDAGWHVSDPGQVSSEFLIKYETGEPSEKYPGQERSDYVLLDKLGDPIAVVEAKKASRDAELGQEQARQYCLNIKKEKGESFPLPFCFYTNGHDIFFWDLGNHPPKKVSGFPTLADLEHYRHVSEHRKTLSHEFINKNIAGRDYQLKAIRKVLEGIEAKQKNFLLVMATGTGKTRTCVALVDALMRAGHVQRILFLVDRIALREQALDAFKEHLPDEPRWPKIGETMVSKNRRIYVATFPTMLNIIQQERNPLSPYFFDLIVVDESHRSIYNTYKQILDYFHTINVGLTATPVDYLDRNTFKLFTCKDGKPTYAFTYKEAIENTPPYLSDFEVLKLRTKFQEEGISKRTLSLQDQQQLIRDGKESELKEMNIDGKALEQTVTNEGTNRKIVQEFMQECIKDPHGVTPGKTIFFCASIKHARRIETLFNSMYPEYAGELARVLVSEDSRVYGTNGLLAQFTNNDMPRIAISVDMLDTGIDVREVVNLVFAKQVFSFTKFWQMIGRGTRLLDDKNKHHWCPNKSHFLIMDCWENFDYFKEQPKGKTPGNTVPLPIRYFAARLDKMSKAMKFGLSDIMEKQALFLQQFIRKLPKQSVTIRDAAPILKKVDDPAYWQYLTQNKIDYLQQHVQPLFKVFSGAGYKAMSFSVMVTECATALMEKEVAQSLSESLQTEPLQKEPATTANNAATARFEKLAASITEKVQQLSLEMDLVRKHKALILSVQQPNYWQKVNDAQLEQLIDVLAPLMHFKTNNQDGFKHYNFEDEIKIKEYVEFGPENESATVAEYQKMVEQLIIQLTRDNPILQKIQQQQSISEDEATQLAELLHAQHPYITEDLLRRVYHNKKARFVEFILHILGIQPLQSYPQKVTEAFEQFIGEHTNLSSKQLEFLGLLKSFIIDKEKVEKRDLVNAPFTQLHPEGILGVFEQSQIDQILHLTEQLAA